MARVTVEDCAEVIPSRFELVAIAAQRAKTIAAGGALTIDRDNDKNAVVALREIAGRTIDVDHLRELIIQSKQEKVNVDQYGVEEVSDEIGADDDSIAEEALRELSAMQPKASISDDEDGEDDLYGGDDVELDD